MVNESTKRKIVVSVLLVFAMSIIVFLNSSYFQVPITNFAIKNLDQSNFVQEGDWNKVYGSYIGGTALFSNVPQSIINTKFEGTNISAILKVGPNSGVIRVHIDNDITVYDLYAKNDLLIKSDLAKDLEPGTHSLKIVVLNMKNNFSRGKNVVIDEILVDDPVQNVENISDEKISKTKNAIASVSISFAENLNGVVHTLNNTKANIVPMLITEKISTGYSRALAGKPFYILLSLIFMIVILISGYKVIDSYQIILSDTLHSLVSHLLSPFRAIKSKFDSYSLEQSKEIKKPKKKVSKVIEKTDDSNTWLADKFHEIYSSISLGGLVVFSSIGSFLELVWAAFAGLKLIYGRVISLLRNAILKSNNFVVNIFSQTISLVSGLYHRLPQKEEDTVTETKAGLSKLRDNIQMPEHLVKLQNRLNKMMDQKIETKKNYQASRPKVKMPEMPRSNISEKLERIKKRIQPAENDYGDYLGEINNRLQTLGNERMQRVRPKIERNVEVQSSLSGPRSVRKVEKSVNERVNALDSYLDDLNNEINQIKCTEAKEESLFQRVKKRIF